jgi:predicted RNA-binding protein with PIN domain
MLREFGPIRRKRYSEPKINAADSEKHKRKKPPKPQQRMVIIDGYNVIYAWESLREIADFSLEKARETLMDMLSNYVAYTKTDVTLVFDAYLVKDGMGSEFTHDGYRVVFTKQDETADARIEAMMVELGPDYNIRVVTGDRLLQYSAVHSGILRMTAAEFEAEVTAVAKEITEFVQKLSQTKK